jgi:hypothetical protein
VQEHLFLLLRQASSKNIPSATKFHVLFRAKESLVYAPSEKIREAAKTLAGQLKPFEMVKQRALHHIWRNLTRWKESISKRIFK